MNVAKIVKALIQKYSTNDPFIIAKSKGMEVHFQPMPDGIRGIVVRPYNQTFFINDNLSYECQRAIAAMMLGYFIWREREHVNPFGEISVFFESGPMSMEPLIFAAHLLLFDIQPEEGETKEDLSFRTGVPVELVQLVTG